MQDFYLKRGYKKGQGKRKHDHFLYLAAHLVGGHSWTQNLGALEAVHLELSGDDGTTWTRVTSDLTNATNTSGTFDWTVTGPAKPNARVRVIWTRDSSVQDTSNVSFRMQ